MSKSDYSENLETSIKNVSLELARIDELQSQWDWLVEHLQVYLLRLKSLCEQFKRPPCEFMRTSVFCNLLVAADHAERILLERHSEPPEWASFRDSLKDLSEAEDVTQCLLCWDSISKSKL